MNGKSVLIFIALFALVATVSEAHKKFFTGPQYGGYEPERCRCDCGHRQQQHHPVLPNKPYYGNAGYAQPSHSSGYGDAGSYAVAGSFGSGQGQASGGY